MVSGNVREAERVFEEAVGVIVARAATGSINIDEATLTALKGIRFDHEQGRINIGNSTVAADVLVTGGSRGATGTTVIGGNTELRSRGTKIEIDQNASIEIKGGASIKQT